MASTPRTVSGRGATRPSIRGTSARPHEQDRTAAAVGNDSHDQSRLWQMAQDGEELNLYLDLIPDAEYGQDAERLESLAAAARELWSK
ncbi:MAG: hypothetical protein WD069_18735 [Planctomycetales bacterium]